jgi:hypothetical protein
MTQSHYHFCILCRYREMRNHYPRYPLNGTPMAYHLKSHHRRSIPSYYTDLAATILITFLATLRQPVHRPHDHCRLLRTSLIYTRQHMGETFPCHCTSNQRLTPQFRRFCYRHLNRCSSSHWILPLKMPNCHLPPSSTHSLSPARKTTI